MPFRKLIPPFTLTGWGGGVVQYIKKMSRTRTYDTRSQQKENNRLLHIFIFIFFYYYFFASFKKKLYFKTYLLIRIFPSAFSHPHFPIRILSSAFCHPHFIIHYPSAISHQPSAIRHPPSAAIRSPLYRDPREEGLHFQQLLPLTELGEGARPAESETPPTLSTGRAKEITVQHDSPMFAKNATSFKLIHLL